MISVRCSNTPVGEHIEVAATFGRRFMGLMFRRKLPEGSGLLLLPCGSIHMCFMRMALDIVYTDARFRVLAVEENLKPWRVGKFVKGAKAVLELPVGTVRRCGVAPGTALEIYPPLTLKIKEKRTENEYERTGSCLES
jgi:uncharacterized membrane protein (UPF0127 family)